VIDPAAMKTSRDIVDRFGPDDAFAAVVLALDAGYGADQIAEHANTITPDGTIPGVAPSGPASGVFASALGDVSAMAAPPGLRLAAEPTPADLLDTLTVKAERGEVLTGPPSSLAMDDKEMGEAFIGAILFLASIGYSFDQVVEGLIFGDLHMSYAYERDCILLAEGDGTVITPAGPPSPGNLGAEDCIKRMTYPGTKSGMRVLIDGDWVYIVTTTTTAPTTTVAAVTFPITFAGSGTLTFTSDITIGECVLDAVLTVTLLPDGLVEGTIESTNFRFNFELSDGVENLVCFEGDPYVTGLIGTHEEGQFDLSVAEQPDKVWLRGDYQADLLTIDQQIVSQVSKDVTITYFSDWVFGLPLQNG
jgi:hypothetical protein